MAVTSKVIKREDLKPGDEVFVVVRYGRDGNQVKRKKARVVDVLRAAVVLDKIEGEAGPRTVRFNEVEPLDSPPPPVVTSRRKAPEPQEPFVDAKSTLKAVPTAFVSIADVKQEAKAKAPAPAPEVASKPAAAPKAEAPKADAAASPLADVSAWIAQGAAMLAKLSSSKADMDAEISLLEEEVLRIQLEIEEKQKERAKIEQMVDALGKMQNAVSS